MPPFTPIGGGRNKKLKAKWIIRWQRIHTNEMVTLLAELMGVTAATATALNSLLYDVW